ncbi:hypothetical protein [Aliamphritea spongicola]|uniref:hypothetical protein n=1 Tax=Aliamphritea spongicola TaxID=707589 RepID=UPI00196B5FC5|nr:hypothetical protein [Aliamphritea spongicola]MBN3562698.1 hypothetical protein [Aliamphritea spongicola]
MNSLKNSQLAGLVTTGFPLADLVFIKVLLAVITMGRYLSIRRMPDGVTRRVAGLLPARRG